MLAVGIKITAPRMKVAACLDDSHKMGEAVLKYQHLESCDIVEQQTHAHDRLQFLLWKVLVKHGEIVAEIEVILAWIALWQGATAIMVHLTMGYAHHLAIHKVEMPAEVYLLVVGKEATIESACLPVVLATYEQTCTSSP